MCVCMYDVSRVAIDSKHVRVFHLETQNVLFFGTNLLDRFTSVASYQKKKKKKKRSARLSSKREVSHFCVLLGLLVDLWQHVNTRNRRDVILEFQNRLAVPSYVHLIKSVLEDIDLVLVGEETGRWLRSAYVVLVGAVPAVAQVARRKLSRGKREGIGGQLVHARACLHRFLFLRLMAKPVDDLVVEDVEAHRRERHPRHYVEGAEPNGHVPRFVKGVAGIGTGNHITEPDRAQAHEAEVTRI